MGLFSGAKAQMTGQKAIKTHISANELVSNGKTAEASEKFQEARKLYESALSLGPQRPGVLQGYAILLMRLGEFDRAGEIMRDISRMQNLTENDWFDLRMNYAIWHWKQGRLDDAIATAKRAAQIKKTTTVYNTLGMYLAEKARQTGDFAEVEAFNREAMDYDDEDAGILDNVGEMYEAMMVNDADPAQAAEHRRLAKEYYAKAHAIKPRQISTLYSLAKLYHEDGEDDKARKVLSHAENLFYSFVCPVTEEMMEALKRQVG